MDCRCGALQDWPCPTTTMTYDEIKMLPPVIDEEHVVEVEDLI